MVKLTALLLVLVSLFPAGCAAPRDIPEGILRVTFLDVGHADCILLQCGDSVCLVDSGEAHTTGQVIRTLRAKGVHRIDLAVLTHPHADHIGGMKTIGQRIPVGIILDSGFPHGSIVQETLMEWVARSGVEWRRARAGQHIQLNNQVGMDVLWPEDTYLRGTESDANNNSVVLRVTHGDVRVLLVGDLQKDAERRLVSRGEELKADLLKVGHQGSRDATSEDFLSRVNPHFAVIVAAENNSYGHPSQEVVDLLKRYGANVLITGRDGELIFESDGRSVRRVQ